MKKTIAIAIDGPVGVGKGTLAVALARKINARYVYTGGMYRALALACLKNNIDIYDEEKVLELLKKISIEYQPVAGGRIFINGEEISDEIFLPEVNRAVPIIAAYSGVRREMVAWQKKMTGGAGVVMEGRDIATDVLPDADIKIYLTADINVRAERRLRQLKKRGIETSFEEVLQEIKERDKLDTKREASPLTITPDAFIIDTTNLTIEGTVEKVMDKLREKGLI